MVVLIGGRKQLDGVCELLLQGRAVLDVLLDLLKGVRGLGWVKYNTTELRVPGQIVEENVMRAVNSHATTVLEGWTPRVAGMGLTGRNIKRLEAPMQPTEAV